MIASKVQNYGRASELMSELRSQLFQEIPSQLLANLNPASQIGSLNLRWVSEGSESVTSQPSSLVFESKHSDQAHVERSHLIYKLGEDLESNGYVSSLPTQEGKVVLFVIMYNSFLVLSNVRLLEARTLFYDGVVRLQEQRREHMSCHQHFDLELLEDKYFSKHIP